MNNKDQEVARVLNAVYIHGKRGNMAVDGFPDDEMSIADGIKVLDSVLLEQLKKREEELRADFLNQKANEHDQEVREQVRREIVEDIKKAIEGRLGGTIEEDVRSMATFNLDDVISIIEKRV